MTGSGSMETCRDPVRYPRAADPAREQVGARICGLDTLDALDTGGGDPFHLGDINAGGIDDLRIQVDERMIEAEDGIRFQLKPRLETLAQRIQHARRVDPTDFIAALLRNSQRPSA